MCESKRAKIIKHTKKNVFLCLLLRKNTQFKLVENLRKYNVSNNLEHAYNLIHVYNILYSTLRRVYLCIYNSSANNNIPKQTHY